jgi:signal transduction histidine kinase
MSHDIDFPRLAAVACHDIRTPLATVYGFSRTLAKLDLDEPAGKYVAMVEAAAAQVGELVEQMALAARIETGRYDPSLAEVDSLALALDAAAALGGERVRVSGQGGTVRVPRVEAERALTQLFRAAQRHGGLDAVEVEVRGAELELSPVTRNSGAVLLGVELRELGAAAAALLVRALGGSLAVEGERLLIRLPD